MKYVKTLKLMIALPIMAALFLTAGSGTGMATSILGDTVTIQYLFPDSSTQFGLSATGTVTATGVTLNLFGNQSVTVFGNDVQMLGTAAGGSGFSPASFNGVSIQDLTNPTAFSGFSIDPATTISAFNISDVSISAGLLFVNYQGLSTPLGSLAQVDFTASAAVPEPGTLPLIAAGLLGAAGLYRRRFHR
jgi:hypothetical protein